MGVPGYEDEYHEASGYDSAAPWLDMSQEGWDPGGSQQFSMKNATGHLVSIGGRAFQSQLTCFDHAQNLWLVK